MAEPPVPDPRYLYEYSWQHCLAEHGPDAVARLNEGLTNAAAIIGRWGYTTAEWEAAIARIAALQSPPAAPPGDVDG